MSIHSSADSSLSGLIFRAKAGDRGALDALLARYRPYLRVVAEKVMRPYFRARFDGSDIVQETCQDAIVGIDHLNGTSVPEFHAWLHRILKNNLANLLRDHTAAKRDVRLEQDIDIGDCNVSIEWNPRKTREPRPESQVIQGEAALLLAHALSMMPGDLRTVIQMRFLESYTLFEIADYLQKSTSTIARMIDRGLQTLHDSLPEGIV